MFGKEPEENQQSYPADLQDVTFTPDTSMAEIEAKQQDTELTELTELESQPNSEKPELVNAVEKISGIISPYFIVLVGLLLYENNFVIGTILIVIGIIFLLKFSWKDVVKFLEEIKKIFGLTQ